MKKIILVVFISLILIGCATGQIVKVKVIDTRYDRSDPDCMCYPDYSAGRYCNTGDTAITIVQDENGHLDKWCGYWGKEGTEFRGTYRNTIFGGKIQK